MLPAGVGTNQQSGAALMKDAGYVSAVSCVNAESNSQVTDLPSGLVIASVDYLLILDVFNWGKDLPQFATHYSLILLSKVEQTCPPVPL